MFVMLFLLATGCQQLEGFETQATGSADRDGDGWSPSQGDCDDGCDGKVLAPDHGTYVCQGWYFHPMTRGELEALSIGSSYDQDCDGVVDSRQAGLDFDGDGYPGVPSDGEVPDCSIYDSQIHPGAEEICDDGVDQDCDGIDLPCEEG